MSDVKGVKVEVRFNKAVVCPTCFDATAKFEAYEQDEWLFLVCTNCASFHRIKKTTEEG